VQWNAVDQFISLCSSQPADLLWHGAAEQEGGQTLVSQVTAWSNFTWKFTFTHSSSQHIILELTRLTYFVSDFLSVCIKLYYRKFCFSKICIILWRSLTSGNTDPWSFPVKISTPIISVLWNVYTNLEIVLFVLELGSHMGETDLPPCLPVDSILKLMTVWRITGKIIRTTIIVNYTCAHIMESLQFWV